MGTARLLEFHTPLGNMAAVSGNGSLCLLVFNDWLSGGELYTYVKKHVHCAIEPGEDEVLGRTRDEIGSYFSGTLQKFTVPFTNIGTEFQRKVWNELQNIAFGETISYRKLAERVGDHDAVRAVAGANSKNMIAIIVPCHRVIGVNGSLTGYSGGLHRKKFLLEMEANYKGHTSGRQLHFEMAD